MTTLLPLPFGGEGRGEGAQPFTRMTAISSYGWIVVVAIIASIIVWSRVAKRDRRLVIIYMAALASAFLGAKLVYFTAEGWLHWNDTDRWLQFATGKSITGGLLGGYVGVEIAKRFVGYRNPTGDLFALVAPIGIILGRVGCILRGCCLGNVCESSWFTMTDGNGIARWPAAPVELLFNALMVGVILLFRWCGILVGQHFHIYLVAYGLFRFLHEFMRATPRIVGPLSGYHIAALAIAALGCAGFVLRWRQRPITSNSALLNSQLLHGLNRR